MVSTFNCGKTCDNVARHTRRESAQHKHIAAHVLVLDGQQWFVTARCTDGEPQTGEAIARECRRVLEDHHLLHDERLVAVVSDQCSANVQAWKSLRVTPDRKYPIIGIGCVPHAINLLIKDAFLKFKVLKELQDQCAALVHFFTYHHAARSALVSGRRHYGLTRTLQKPCDTRWNSQVDCLESVNEHYNAILMAVAAPDVKKLLAMRENAACKKVLEDPEFKSRLAFAVALLNTPAELLDNMQADAVTLGDVLPTFSKIVQHFTDLHLRHLPPPAYHSFYSELKALALDRMSKLNVDGVLHFVCAVTPHTRNNVLDDPATVEQATVEARAFFRKLFPDTTAHSAAMVQFLQYTARAKPFDDDDNWNLQFPRDQGELWWRNWQSKAPELATAARRLLAIPPSSACIERVFSRLSRFEDSRPNLVVETLVQRLVTTEYLERTDTQLS